MTDQPVTFSKPCLRRMIQMYKEHPVLWKIRSKKKDFKEAKDEAMKKITLLAQQYNPRINRVHVLKKIESLRACHRKERRKVEINLKKNKTYKPTLWYYDSLSFLNVKEARRPISEVDDNDDEYQEDQSSDVEDEVKPASPFFKGEYVQEFDKSRVNIPAPEPSTYSIRKDLMQSTSLGDEYDAIGINVAAKLRSLPTGMRILGEKLINEVLYQAQMNTLSPNTVIVTQDPFKNEC